jgi:hypothetical protein
VNVPPRSIANRNIVGAQCIFVEVEVTVFVGGGGTAAGALMVAI